MTHYVTHHYVIILLANKGSVVVCVMLWAAGMSDGPNPLLSGHHSPGKGREEDCRKDGDGIQEGSWIYLLGNRKR